MQGGAPPLVCGIYGSATCQQSLQTLIVTAGSRIVKRSPGSERNSNEDNKSNFIQNAIKGKQIR